MPTPTMPQDRGEGFRPKLEGGLERIFEIGEAVLYWSRSKAQWLPAAVQGYNQGDFGEQEFGWSYKLDVQPLCCPFYVKSRAAATSFPAARPLASGLVAVPGGLRAYPASSPAAVASSAADPWPRAMQCSVAAPVVSRPVGAAAAVVPVGTAAATTGAPASWVPSVGAGPASWLPNARSGGPATSYRQPVATLGPARCMSPGRQVAPATSVVVPMAFSYGGPRFQNAGTVAGSLR
ncbi:unnamed protein product, partial [Polarella glacialis]